MVRERYFELLIMRKSSILESFGLWFHFGIMRKSSYIFLNLLVFNLVSFDSSYWDEPNFLWTWIDWVKFESSKFVTNLSRVLNWSKFYRVSNL